ncbi:MAG: SDR family NAD(P)-dependent oxidoreductase, partial [Caldilineaceae bacterium]|nr:SDR family NAD(P)-dependent oxidoreductase [Caldilineaceae bacterium]
MTVANGTGLLQDAVRQGFGRLKDRVAIVTGSARGIGAATATAFAREGAQVVICDVMAEQGKEFAESLNDHYADGRPAAIFVP